MIDLEDRHREIIKHILAKYPYEFYAFGSRVVGKAKKFSDLDLCYKENISDSIIGKLREDFEESNLPFTVDIVDWDRCTEEFKKNIEMDLVKVSEIL